jgi:hypothetical protein
MTAADATVMTSMSSVCRREARGTVIRPPMRNPIANPNTTRGKKRLIWRISRSRLA